MNKLDGFVLSLIADCLDGSSLFSCLHVDRELSKVCDNSTRWEAREALHDAVALHRAAHRLFERCARPPDTAINEGLPVVRLIVQGSRLCGQTGGTGGAFAAASSVSG